MDIAKRQRYSPYRITNLHGGRISQLTLDKSIEEQQANQSEEDHGKCCSLKCKAINKFASEILSCLVLCDVTKHKRVRDRGNDGHIWLDRCRIFDGRDIIDKTKNARAISKYRFFISKKKRNMTPLEIVRVIKNHPTNQKILLQFSKH